MERHNVRLSRYKRGGKWIVRLEGVTSGFVVHVNDCDSAVIEFGLDDERFEPVLAIGKSPS